MHGSGLLGTFRKLRRRISLLASVPCLLEPFVDTPLAHLVGKARELTAMHALDQGFRTVALPAFPVHLALEALPVVLLVLGVHLARKSHEVICGLHERVLGRLLNLLLQHRPETGTITHGREANYRVIDNQTGKRKQRDKDDRRGSSGTTSSMSCMTPMTATLFPPTESSARPRRS